MVAYVRSRALAAFSARVRAVLRALDARVEFTFVKRIRAIVKMVPLVMRMCLVV